MLAEAKRKALRYETPPRDVVLVPRWWRREARAAAAQVARWQRESEARAAEVARLRAEVDEAHRPPLPPEPPHPRSAAISPGRRLQPSAVRPTVRRVPLAVPAAGIAQGHREAEGHGAAGASRAPHSSPVDDTPDWREGDAPDRTHDACIHNYPRGSCTRCGVHPLAGLGHHPTANPSQGPQVVLPDSRGARADTPAVPTSAPSTARPSSQSVGTAAKGPPPISRPPEAQDALRSARSSGSARFVDLKSALVTILSSGPGLDKYGIQTALATTFGMRVSLSKLNSTLYRCSESFRHEDSSSGLAPRWFVREGLASRHVGPSATTRAAVQHGSQHDEGGRSRREDEAVREVLHLSTSGSWTSGVMGRSQRR